jgi:hypothetical protein
MNKNLRPFSMKKFFEAGVGRWLWVVLFALGVAQATQAQGDVFSGAKLALKSGNSRDLARHFNNNIELIVESENVEFDKVSNTQAELILKNFFQKNPAKDFNYVHQGSSPEGAQYSTGTYQAQNGKYLVYIVLKQFGGKYMIDRIDFRRE